MKPARPMTETIQFNSTSLRPGKLNCSLLTSWEVLVSSDEQQSVAENFEVSVSVLSEVLFSPRIRDLNAICASEPSTCKPAMIRGASRAFPPRYRSARAPSVSSSLVRPFTKLVSSEKPVFEFELMSIEPSSSTSTSVSSDVSSSW